jgi:hypothetical protein
MAVTETKKTKKKNAQIDILKNYMEYVLEHEHAPKSIYKFCKESNIKEDEFYSQYGSFQSLEKAVWTTFHDHTLDLMEKNDKDAMSPREQLLTYYFTLFELLTANRSYCLLVLGTHKLVPTNLSQLDLLRKRIKHFSKGLIELGNENKSSKLFQHSENIFSEAVWVQFMFLLRFWVKDSSPGFEKTDVAIEKSVQTAFDLFETKPLESLLDFGKFLWKENRM